MAWDNYDLVFRQGDRSNSLGPSERIIFGKDCSKVDPTDKSSCADYLQKLNEDDLFLDKYIYYGSAVFTPTFFSDLNTQDTHNKYVPGVAIYNDGIEIDRPQLFPPDPNTGGYFFDGAVPLESAFHLCPNLNNCQTRVEPTTAGDALGNIRSILTPSKHRFLQDYDHTQMWQGVEGSDELFNWIKDDLDEIAQNFEEMPVVSAPISGVVPGVFTTNGGTFELSVSPLDPAGDLISAGLSLGNFSFTPITVADATDPTTPVTSGDAVPTSFEIIQPGVAAGITAVLVFDNSTSMRDNDPGRLRIEAGKQFISQLDSNDQVAIIDFGTGFFSFGSRVLQTFTSDQTLLNTAIERVAEDAFGTFIFNSLSKAIDLLNDQGANNPLIIILTDGEDNRSSANFLDVVNRAKASSIPVFPIGLGSGDLTNIPQLQDLASQTGGTFASVQDPAGLTTLFGNMAIATTVGRVVVTAEGTFNPPLGSTGTFIIFGSLITTSGGNTITTPFDFQTNITQASSPGGFSIGEF